VTTSERLPRPVEVGSSQGYRKGSILADWLSSTDHKIIGHRYLITSFGFFLAGGIMAMIMRAQLMGPGQPHRVGLLDVFPGMIV
jgi:cytochrome c oxidase subunit I